MLRYLTVVLHLVYDATGQDPSDDEFQNILSRFFAHVLSATVPLGLHASEVIGEDELIEAALIRATDRAFQERVPARVLRDAIDDAVQIESIVPGGATLEEMRAHVGRLLQQQLLKN